jgi:hypothetical protein
MSKKSKKAKKPKPLDIKILSATDVEYYICHKFEIINEDFWDWLFSDTPRGETGILLIHQNDSVPEEYLDYIRLIRDEFDEYADDESCLEIENDF